MTNDSESASAKLIGETVGAATGELFKYAFFIGTTVLIALKVFAGAKFSWWWCLLPAAIELAFIAIALIIALSAIAAFKAGK